MSGRALSLPKAVLKNLPECDYIPAPEAVFQKACQTIERFQMLSDGNGVLVGVSGGPDSMTLLHVLHRLCEEHGYNLHAAHLNHQLRGEEADADVRCVKELCERLSIPCTVHEVNVAERSVEWKVSIAQAGRRARYEFFREVMQEQGLSRLALGHTADDVVETMFMNLFRGTGLEGLVGVPPVSEGYIVRPLLNCWRAETQVYARVHRLGARMDSSNFNRQILRNWVRLELLPLLRERISPDLDDALLRLVELVREDLHFLHEQARERLEEVATQTQPRCVILNREKFLAQPKSMQRWILRGALEHLRGSLHGAFLTHIEEVIGIVERHSTDAMFNLPSGVLVRVEKGKVIVQDSGILNPP